MNIANRQDTWFTGLSSESFDFESSETPLNHSKSPNSSHNQENLLPRSPAHPRRLRLQVMPFFDQIDSVECEGRVTGTVIHAASFPRFVGTSGY